MWFDLTDFYLTKPAGVQKEVNAREFPVLFFLIFVLYVVAGSTGVVK
jgi:hypothetical protein